MAFSRKGLNTQPSPSGAGGFAVYCSEDDLPDVKAANYWHSVVGGGSTVADRRALQGLRDLVADQGIAGASLTKILPLLLLCNGGMEWTAIGPNPGTDELQLAAAAWIIT